MDNWEIKKICEISTVKGGKRIPKGYTLQEENNGYPYITVSDMKENGISLKNIKYVPLEILNKIKNYKIYSNEIYISVAGTIGNVGIVPKELNGANLTENADKFTNIKINQLFLLHFLRSSLFQNVINNNKTTSAQPKLAIEKINNIEIPVPPLAEQEKIVSILSKQDEVIEKLEALIELKAKQKKGLMQKLLSGKVRLKEFDGEWVNVKLRDIISEISEKTTVNNQYDILSITKQGIVPQKLFFDKQVASENNVGYKIVLKDNIVFSPMNLWMGSIGFCEYQNGIVSPAYKVFKINNKYGIFNFLKYYMKTKKFINLYNINSRLGASKVRKNLDLELLLESDIEIPTLDEQSAIASILSKCDKEIDLLKQKLELNKKQKKWLMQKLLSGEIRVKEV